MRRTTHKKDKTSQSHGPKTGVRGLLNEDADQIDSEWLSVKGARILKTLQFQLGEVAEVLFSNYPSPEANAKLANLMNELEPSNRSPSGRVLAFKPKRTGRGVKLFLLDILPETSVERRTHEKRELTMKGGNMTS